MFVICFFNFVVCWVFFRLNFLVNVVCRKHTKWVLLTNNICDSLNKMQALKNRQMTFKNIFVLLTFYFDKSYFNFITFLRWSSYILCLIFTWYLTVFPVHASITLLHSPTHSSSSLYWKNIKYLLRNWVCGDTMESGGSNK